MWCEKMIRFVFTGFVDPVVWWMHDVVYNKLQVNEYIVSNNNKYSLL